MKTSEIAAIRAAQETARTLDDHARAYRFRAQLAQIDRRNLENSCDHLLEDGTSAYEILYKDPNVTKCQICDDICHHGRPHTFGTYSTGIVTK